MELQLPTLPPYEWGKLYNAAINMDTHLPGVKLDTTTTTTLTEYGFDVLNGAQDIIAHVSVAAGDEWEWGHTVWAQAVCDAPHIKSTQSSDWINTLQPTMHVISSTNLASGDPVGLRQVPDRPDLDGVGATLIDGASPDHQLVQPRPICSIGNETQLEKPILVPAECVRPLPNWPLLGISLACLHAFSNAFGLVDREQVLQRDAFNASTEDVCNRIVKPLTEGQGESLASILQRCSRAVDPESGTSWVGRPTVFVSHARKYRFVDLLYTVNDYAADIWSDTEDYFWIDIFSQYQHWIGDVGSEARAVNWDVVFQLTIPQCRHTCFVLSPWDAPLPLQRAWMLWEALITLNVPSTRFAVRLPPPEMMRLMQAMHVKDFELISRTLIDVDSRKATCYTSDDEAMIHSAIGQSVGHAELNQRISGELREWIQHHVARGLQLVRSEGRMGLAGMPFNMGKTLLELGDLNGAEELFRELVEARRSAWGGTHKHTLTAMNGLLQVMQKKSSFEEAYTIATELLQLTCSAHGKHSQEALLCLNNLAAVQRRRGNRQSLIATQTEVVDTMRQVHGSRHEHTLAAITNLASLLKDQADYAGAGALYGEVLIARIEDRGERHPDTLLAKLHVASLQTKQGDHATASAAASEVLGISREAFGQKHKLTINATTVLAQCLQNQEGRRSEAIALYRELLQTRRELVSGGSEEMFRAMRTLIGLLRSNGDLEDSISLRRELVEAHDRIHGTTHEKTQKAASELAGALQKAGKKEEARALAERHYLVSKTKRQTKRQTPEDPEEGAAGGTSMAQDAMQDSD